MRFASDCVTSSISDVAESMPSGFWTKSMYGLVSSFPSRMIANVRT